MNSGIYKIQSIAHPERFYIGSAKDIRGRMREHLNRLKRGNHANPILQNHFNKYGEEDLNFTVITYCELSELIKTEQFYIDSLNPPINICRVAGNTIGRPQSEETRRKRSIAMTGKTRENPMSEEIRLSMVKAAHTRYKVPDEVNGFLLMRESTYRSYGSKRKHVFMCAVCSNLSILTVNQAKEGKCVCRRTCRVKARKQRPYRPKQPTKYNILRNDNTTGYAGVTYDKQAKAYRARLKVKGKLLHIGNYPTPIEAYEARQARIKALCLPVR